MPRQRGETFPTAGHVVEYLHDYEQRYELPVHRPVTVLEVADAPREGARHAAIVACFDGVATPADLGAVALEIGGALRSLGSSSRVVTVFEDPEAATDPTLRAARQGVTGLTRSIAHEMRRGGTANGLVLGEGVPLTAPGAAGALAFLLSGRAAYVSGQFVPVATADGAVPADAARPLAGKVAVVTGAARGIGAAIVRTLARDGAVVVGVDVPAAGEALAEVVNEVGGTALAHVGWEWLLLVNAPIALIAALGVHFGVPADTREGLTHDRLDLAGAVGHRHASGGGGHGAGDDRVVVEVQRAGVQLHADFAGAGLRHTGPCRVGHGLGAWLVAVMVQPTCIPCFFVKRSESE